MVIKIYLNKTTLQGNVYFVVILIYTYLNFNYYYFFFLISTILFFWQGYAPRRRRRQCLPVLAAHE